jgi:hypothetical protein
MKAGVVYPQVELGGDTGAVKPFAAWPNVTAMRPNTEFYTMGRS